MAYDLVSIKNNTPYDASGKVTYPSLFCRDDNYSVAGGGGKWTASSRGLCLVSEITAQLNVNGGLVEAAPYKSSGTTYGEFMIIEPSPGNFTVVSLVDFTCYVTIVNNTNYPMVLSGTPIAGSWDSYRVAPPASIAPLGQANIEIVSGSSLAGTDGSCSYTVQNADGSTADLNFKYACPWSANPNYAVASWNNSNPLNGISIMVIPNPVPNWGHPLYARFTITQA